jgi:glucokinase
MFFSRQGITGKEMADKAAAKDDTALDLWKQFGRHLGKFLQVILFTYDPEAIIIGGGIASSAPYFEQSMLDSMRDGFPYQHEVDNVHVLFSQLKDCNLLGASEL